MRPLFRTLAASSLALLIATSSALAQNISTPPSGDNQKASVSQWIGLVKVTIDYSSPDVHSPTGEDRTGHIWGELVPYGMHDLGFNDCKSCPWRAGANENTAFAVSHDVTIEGQPLAAGRYGLHMVAGKDEWTVIFTKRADAWGSYFYEPSDEALRVTVKPSACEFHEWLTYEFTDRQPAQATVALRWEKLQVPFTIKVPDATALYAAKIQDEMHSGKAFDWWNLDAAAQFWLQNKLGAKQAVAWAEKAVAQPGVGNENFQTLSTLAMAHMAAGDEAAATRTIDRAMASGGLTATAMHGFARQLQGIGRPKDAMRVFETNAKRFNGQWPTGFGLARGYDGLGETAKAIAAAKKALPSAPDEPNRRNIEAFITRLEKKASGK